MKLPWNRKKDLDKEIKKSASHLREVDRRLDRLDERVDALEEAAAEALSLEAATLGDFPDKPRARKKGTR